MQNVQGPQREVVFFGQQWPAWLLAPSIALSIFAMPGPMAAKPWLPAVVVLLVFMLFPTTITRVDGGEVTVLWMLMAYRRFPLHAVRTIDAVPMRGMDWLTNYLSNSVGYARAVWRNKGDRRFALFEPKALRLELSDGSTVWIGSRHPERLLSAIGTDASEHPK